MSQGHRAAAGWDTGEVGDPSHARGAWGHLDTAWRLCTSAVSLAPALCAPAGQSPGPAQGPHVAPGRRLRTRRQQQQRPRFPSSFKEVTKPPVTSWSSVGTQAPPTFLHVNKETAKWNPPTPKGDSVDHPSPFVIFISKPRAFPAGPTRPHRPVHFRPHGSWTWHALMFISTS